MAMNPLTLVGNINRHYHTIYACYRGLKVSVGRKYRGPLDFMCGFKIKVVYKSICYWN